MAGGATFSKRQKERSRQERQREKLERKREAAQNKQTSGSGPEIDWNHSQGDFGVDDPTTQEKEQPE